MALQTVATGIPIYSSKIIGMFMLSSVIIAFAYILARKISREYTKDIKKLAKEFGVKI